MKYIVSYGVEVVWGAGDVRFSLAIRDVVLQVSINGRLVCAVKTSTLLKGDEK